MSIMRRMAEDSWISCKKESHGETRSLVTVETACEKLLIEMQRGRGSMPEDDGIAIADAKSGVVEASHP